MFKARWLAAVAVLVLAVGGAQTLASVMVDVTYTGDNVVEAFYQDGSSPVAIAVGPNANNWHIADTATLDLEYGDYQLIFRVSNLEGPGSGNPAALLAQISGPVVGDLLSSSSWDYALYDGTTPTDFDTLDWNAATEWGNNGGPNIWTSVHGGPVAGISTSAQWIWDDINFGGGEDFHAELWLRAEFSAVPEPASIAVWSLLGGLGLIVGWRRRRRAA